MSVLGAGVFCLVFPSSSSLLCWAAPALPLLFEPFVSSLSLLLSRALSFHNYRDGLKDQELRGKQREIDRLYGKLAVASPLTDAEMRRTFAEALERLAEREK